MFDYYGGYLCQKLFYDMTRFYCLINYIKMD